MACRVARERRRPVLDALIFARVAALSCLPLFQGSLPCSRPGQGGLTCHTRSTGRTVARATSAQCSGQQAYPEGACVSLSLSRCPAESHPGGARLELGAHAGAQRGRLAMPPLLRGADLALGQLRHAQALVPGRARPGAAAARPRIRPLARRARSWATSSNRVSPPASRTGLRTRACAARGLDSVACNRLSPGQCSAGVCAVQAVGGLLRRQHDTVCLAGVPALPGVQRGCCSKAPLPPCKRSGGVPSQIEPDKQGED